jgi:hypothetical protein
MAAVSISIEIGMATWQAPAVSGVLAYCKRRPKR